MSSSDSSSFLYTVRTNRSKAFREYVSMLKLDVSKIYIVTDVRSVSTKNYGDRYVVTFDDAFDTFMPNGFAKDWKDEMLKSQLVFFKSNPKKGLYGRTEYATYDFIVPKPDGCLCHIFNQSDDDDGNGNESSCCSCPTTMEEYPVMELCKCLKTKTFHNINCMETYVNAVMNYPCIFGFGRGKSTATTTGASTSTAGSASTSGSSSNATTTTEVPSTTNKRLMEEDDRENTVKKRGTE